ncbi:MAG: 3'-5' exonuclease [Treponema sp.]|uniref:3'-5' exonuclease n=1 Tax=Treponema sp. TaxID=166 RepID=UPI003FA2B99B
MRHKIKPADFVQMFESGAAFTAFDTETTGLYPSSDRVIEIGAVKFDKNGVRDTFNILINPERTMPENSFKVHGINDEMLKNAPLFADAVSGFLDFIEGTRLAAHNAGFDVDFINTELARAGLNPIGEPFIPAADTVYLARKLFPRLEKHNLQFLAQSFSIPPGTAHRALDDALVCREVFLRCIAEYRKKHPVENMLF